MFRIIYVLKGTNEGTIKIAIGNTITDAIKNAVEEDGYKVEDVTGVQAMEVE